jgi:hypothetical protein
MALLRLMDECHKRAFSLALELDLDKYACRKGEGLTLNEIAAMARRAGRAALMVMAFGTTVCLCCDVALGLDREPGCGYCPRCSSDRLLAHSQDVARSMGADRARASGSGAEGTQRRPATDQ